MKLILLKNNKSSGKSKLNTIELFGLSRSGKTFFLKDLIKKGKRGLLNENISKFKKLFLFIRHFLINPFSTSRIFCKTNKNWIFLKELNIRDYYKIFLLRNSYLVSVFAKYELLKNLKKETFLDEFLIQSLQIILQKKSSEREISSILKNLPQSGKILLIESPERVRYERIKKTRFPGEQINRNYSIVWMRNTEFNYNIIKRLLLKNYGPALKDPLFIH